MIALTVNGKPRYVDGSVDLVSFLKSYDVNLQHVAVGYNGIVLEKDRYPEVLLKEGDVLEIVRPVGGG
ncbi:MAG: sulfur carrier protein ThiS [Dehalococcoidia bacterium]|nr:sulfur carrier protein ThiS [Dehalococcoidia bacterium]